MLIKTTIYYQEQFLPNHRCKIERTRVCKEPFTVEIEEITKEKFPVAMIVSDFHKRTEVRAANGSLWRPIRFSEKRCGSKGWWPASQIKYYINGTFEPYCETDESLFSPDKSIVTGSTRNKVEKSAIKSAADFLLCNGKVWESCNEPMYEWDTFGLGHNHGGTGLFVEWGYNPNLSWQHYFNALHRKEAIAAAVRVATKRGDTDDIASLKKGRSYNIKVLMPEMVKSNPEKDYGGKGDPFMNQLNALTSSADSVAEAGLLVMAAGLNVIKD